MKNELSIGGVVYNNGYYLLLQYGLGHWGFVKGHVDEGESDRETLLRELREETGIVNATIVDGFMKEITYFFRSKRELVKKKVRYYIVLTDEKEVVLSFEHKDYRWLRYEDALNLLSFKSSKEVLMEANEFIAREKL